MTPAFAPRLVVMVKAPRPGRVKSRLARDIGAVEAVRFYRVATAALLRRLADDRRWQCILAVTPEAELSARLWPADLARIAQGRGDLGDRMQAVFDSLPPGPVAIIGSDIPALDRRHVAAAFALLGGHDAVFGPAADGGYWLVGLRRRPRVPRIFANVRWSGPYALADTLANCRDLRVGFLETLHDVDTVREYHDWRRLEG